MKKRILAAVLWFYAFWYVGAMVAFALGISPLLGPIIGATAAILFAGDPRRIIWAAPRPASSPAISPQQEPV